MSERTGISWTRSTFNPWLGCQRVSPGCEHCYAETFVGNRMGYNGTKLPTLWGPRGDRKRTSAAYWRQPLRWNRIASETGEFWPVFCASLADVFEDRDELIPWRSGLFQVIDQTPCLTWQLLTKRPENIMSMLPGPWSHVPDNVWLGTTAEDEKRYEERVAGHLAHIACRVRFVSIEPQIGPVTLRHGAQDWMIVGGESGPGARPFDLRWLDKLIVQAREVEAPLFVKQYGEVYARAHGFKSRHGSDPSEWDPVHRIQELPFGLRMGIR